MKLSSIARVLGLAAVIVAGRLRIRTHVRAHQARTRPAAPAAPGPDAGDGSQAVRWPTKALRPR